MAEQRLCPHCQAWMLRTEDAWCAHCAAPVAQLDFTLSPDVLQLRNIAPPLAGALTNRSCADLPLDRADLPDWLTLGAVPAVLAAGATVQVSGKARTLLVDVPQLVRPAIHTPAGLAEATLLLLEENPTLRTHPPELELWGTGTRTLEFKLAPVVGALRIRSLARGPVGELAPSSPAVPFLASEQSALPVSVKLDADRLRRNPAASLSVEYDGPFGPRQVELPLKFLLREPPQLRWAGEDQAPRELFASTGQRLEVVLSNQAPDGREGGARNARLTLEAIHLAPPRALAGLPVRLLTPLPVMLRGGESATLLFELDLNGFAAPDLRRGPDALQLQLTAKAEGVTLERPVPVLVRQLPVFDGVLAIDFGSSNTCAALVETGREVETLPLDGAAEVSPTLLRYDDLTGPVPQIETGARIQRLALIDDRSSASTLRGLKQKLGDFRQDLPVRPYHASDWTTRTATEASADYLRELRRIVEARKQTVFRDFILTHPAVCSLRQYRNLRAALTAAFGEAGASTIRFLQEPLAALIPFFAQRAGVKAQASPYTVASFDLGGGTTDLAIVRVEHTSAGPGRLEIRPAILYSRGVRFGGEDLTGFLVDRMTAAATELLAQSRPGAVLIVKGTAGAATEDVLRNQLALGDAAEQFKVSLSDEAKDTGQTAPELPALTLRILPAGKNMAEDFSVPSRDLTTARGAGLKALFLAELVERISGIAALLKEAEVQTGTLDFIQLSGKTAYLPMIGKCLRESFPDSKVVRAADPKECVVTGACLSRAMSRRASQRLILPDAATRTTSAIGFYDVMSSQFTPILPVDTAIPAGGLERALAGAWFGSEPLVLWENLGVSSTELQRSESASRLLSKLGTWQPNAMRPDAEAAGWPVRVRLVDFELEVEALGPAGETVVFERLRDAAETGGSR